MFECVFVCAHMLARACVCVRARAHKEGGIWGVTNLYLYQLEANYCIISTLFIIIIIIINSI